MNKNIMLYVDTKVHKFDHIVAKIEHHFNVTSVKISRKNIILSQCNDNIIFDVTPRHIKCIISEKNLENNVKNINEFIDSNFRGEIVGVHYNETNMQEEFIKPQNVHLIKI